MGLGRQKIENNKRPFSFCIVSRRKKSELARQSREEDVLDRIFADAEETAVSERQIDDLKVDLSGSQREILKEVFCNKKSFHLISRKLGLGLGEIKLLFRNSIQKLKRYWKTLPENVRDH